MPSKGSRLGSPGYPDTLSGIALADGDHTIELKMSKWFWPLCETTKRFYVTVTGGELVPPVTIPAVVDLESLVRRATVKLTWIADWNETFEDPDFTGFGVWRSTTTPVDISGAPSITVAYSGAQLLHTTSYIPTTSEYVAVAGYKDSSRGAYEEIYVPYWTTEPDEPLNQRLVETEESL